MKRTRSWMGAGLVLALPAMAQADDLEVPAYTAVPPCIERSGEPVIGTVVALNGAATIASPGCSPVAAECGTALYAGQTLATGGGGSVGLLAGTHYVQVAGDSSVVIESADGAQRVVVETGSARVIDLGTKPGPAVAVATPTLSTADAGDDVVASAPTQGKPSICSYADPIQVREGERVASVAAGDCHGPPVAAVPVASTPPVSAGPPGGTALVAFAVPPLSIASIARCDVAGGDPGVSNVAAGPPVTVSRDPFPPPAPPPPYCVGGACSGNPPPPPPPPSHGCCRGGIGEQPVVSGPPPD